MNPRELHLSSKILIIALVGVTVYLAAFAVLSPAIPNGSGRGMGPGHMMGSFSTTGNIIVNTSSIGLGVLGMLLTSLYLFRGHERAPADKDPDPAAGPKDEFSILSRALTEDERVLLEKVREVPDGITQDSLRFRLDWSKAKVSTMLTNLDRMGLVQRERFGKTYKVYYQEKAA